MKPFGQWLNDFKPKVDIVPEVASDWVDEPELIPAICRVCGRDIDPEEYGIAPEDVTEDTEFYCGGSPSCCP